MINVVYGPPCGGKTTYVKERVGSDDLVIDIDSINMALTWKGTHERQDSAQPFVFAMRQILLNVLERDGFKGEAVWIISGAPTEEDRLRFIQRFDANLIPIIPTEEECHERCDLAERPKHWHHYIKEWFQKFNENDETRTTPENKRHMKTETRYFSQQIVERSQVNEEERTIELAFSSETPVERQFGSEVLDHSAESVNLNRLNDGAPLLLEHDRSQQIGVIEKARVDDDRVGRAVVRFSKSALAEEIFQDVKDGIRRLVSVGYVVGEFAKEKAESGLETLRAINWEPLEVSIVSVPADANVGIGRADEELKTEENENNMETPTEEQRSEVVEQPAPKPEVRIEVRPDKRAAEIAELGRKFDASTEAVEFIGEGKTADDFKTYLMERAQKAEPIEAKQEPEVGLNQREKQEYSLVRAIKNFSETGRLGGFEADVSQEIANRSGRSAQGFFVPNDVFKRDLTATGGDTGDKVVSTDLGEFIDALGAEPLVVSLGAKQLSGLSGNVALPKGGAATAYWTAENAAATESTMTLSQLSLSPNRVAAYSEISKQLIAQASYDIEGIIRDDLNKQLNLAIDLAAIQGSGSSNEPTGITNTSSINTVTMAGSDPAYADVIDVEEAVETDNALAGQLAYVMTPAVKAQLRKTAVDSGSGRFIMEGANLNGYRAEATTQSPATTLIFGDFSQLIVAEWGSGVDLVVDPYSLALTGLIRVHVSRMADVGVRHPAAFCTMATT